ncbi:efflux RND transporter periplasmic adaptor subunit [Fertoebacter nigrum]|uniref:Efflux RND transporter periplasmic adaptor subunit n=1 Tax=Fertoeibacter niger TaxID=2656921 RepID=A0A8X8H5J2_9RHOB|nr:efflux RND transporter periplasmic adaptor subunit [Fertoeibacter niger]NUB46043.1 efflux RND transporter periplasmic adaptor subunit [Fertoeibacter niger]
MMKIMTQTVLALGILAGALAIWINYIPSALPLLARYGVLDALGIAAPAEEGATAGGQAVAGQPPRGGQGAGGGRPGGPPAGPVAVMARPAELRAMNDQVAAIGDGQPYRSVTLVPEVTGVLDTVNVTSGAYVEQGVVLATLRDEVQRIARDRAQLQLADAEAAMNRLEALGNSGAVTELQRSDARLTLQTAALALREAELELERRRIIAPIAGWVGILSAEPGDQVSPQNAFAQIDDRSRVLVEFRVPERFVGRITEGSALTATPLANPQMVLDGRISAIDSRVDPASRTLLMQAVLENSDDMLRAGMAFNISLSFAGDSFPAVDPLAIQWNSDGSFVWVVREGKAQRAAVRIMQRNSDSVLVAGELAEGDLVVTEGVQSLRPGMDLAPRVAENPEQITPAVLPVSTEG